MSALLMAWLVCFALAVATGVWLYAQLFRGLRERHPVVYRELGSPRIRNTSLRTSLAVQRFLRRRGERELGDEELERVGQRIRWLHPVYGLVLLVGLAALLAPLAGGA